MTNAETHGGAIASIFLDPKNLDSQRLIECLRVGVKNTIRELPQAAWDDVLHVAFKKSITEGVDLSSLATFAAFLRPLNVEGKFPLNRIRDACEEFTHEEVLGILRDFEEK